MKKTKKKPSNPCAPGKWLIKERQVVTEFDVLFAVMLVFIARPSVDMQKVPSTSLA